MKSLISKAFRLALKSIQPSIKWETGDLSSEVKQQKFDSLFSPPSSVEVKDVWTYMTPPITAPNILNFDVNRDVLTLAPIALPSGNKPAKCVTDERLSQELSARKIIPLQAGN